MAQVPLEDIVFILVLSTAFSFLSFWYILPFDAPGLYLWAAQALF
jgi:hypothetical protein